MANYDDASRRWVDRTLGRTKRPNLSCGGRMIFEDDVVYSYGHHFPLLRVLRDRRGRMVGTILNGDRYSVTTTRHQGYARDMAAKLGVPSVTIPFEALRSAGIDPREVRIVASDPERWDTITTTFTIRPPRHAWETVDVTTYGDLGPWELARKAKRLTAERMAWWERNKAWRPDEPMPEPVTVDTMDHYQRRGVIRTGAEVRLAEWTNVTADFDTFGVEIPSGADGIAGMAIGAAAVLAGAMTGHAWITYTRTTHRHWLGGSVIYAPVRWTSWVDMPDGTRDRKRHVRWAYFVSGFDENESRELYFLSELPRGSKPKTYRDAIECLKPEPVKVAEAMGRKVMRQGDVFAVEIPSVDKRTLRKRGATFARMAHVLGTSHVGTDVAVLDGVTYARGCLKHDPGRWRRPDHARIKLGNGKTWHVLVKNTVPTVGASKGRG